MTPELSICLRVIEGSAMASAFQKNQFAILLFVFQIVFFVLFGLFGTYHNEALPPDVQQSVDYVNSKYPMFQDVHVMIFVGFGFLMTFLKRYGFSAVSVNMLLACFTIQWGMIVRGLITTNGGTFAIRIEDLLTADFAAAVILITMGCMLGKLSPSQYVIMAFIETPVAIGIEHVVVHVFHVNDIGGSMIVHVFGAYFGLALSRVFYKKEYVGHENEGSTYHTDIFAMIGALFLWLFWPSFNAAPCETEDARHRAVMNTYLAMCSATIATFLISFMVNKHRHIDMVHIANSTLAGGVAIGTNANVILSPLHALLVGFIAGILSVIGYQYITPFMTNKLKMHDTCGVHNLHGMPGVLAGLTSVLFALVYDPKLYGNTLGSIYKATAHERDMKTQALYQLAGLGLVLGSALVSGAITGIILKLKIWNQVRDKEFYADGDYFHTPDDYDFTTRIISNIDHVEVTEHTKLKDSV
ncbi:hypothetical protein L596_028708 [Steinernema carpocapsae]|uniref:Ammonium transporter AmtB-like domain-containing protein n=1 Tax=Steinernema carpocapsae TaxID=34508 RepID=A0A4U5LZ84_STECR|nr:hypothetical protein L596_028708 [Steinernema carpocapsae]